MKNAQADEGSESIDFIDAALVGALFLETYRIALGRPWVSPARRQCSARTRLEAMFIAVEETNAGRLAFSGQESNGVLRRVEVGRVAVHPDFPGIDMTLDVQACAPLFTAWPTLYS